jgi:hypothetical protein
MVRIATIFVTLGLQRPAYSLLMINFRAKFKVPSAKASLFIEIESTSKESWH